MGPKQSELPSLVDFIVYLKPKTFHLDDNARMNTSVYELAVEFLIKDKVFPVLPSKPKTPTNKWFDFRSQTITVPHAATQLSDLPSKDPQQGATGEGTTTMTTSTKQSLMTQTIQRHNIHTLQQNTW